MYRDFINNRGIYRMHSVNYLVQHMAASIQSWIIWIGFINLLIQSSNLVSYRIHFRISQRDYSGSIGNVGSVQRFVKGLLQKA